MTGGRQQTAVQGVATAKVLNVAGKAVTLLRQVIITAYFGFSARLDAFLVGLDSPISLLLPGFAVRLVRETVLESFPRLRRGSGRSA